MPSFRNTSDQVFIDGNITVLPNQQWTVTDPHRIEQLTTQYGWQFECLESPQQAEEAPKATKSISKMNRAELEALANEVGLAVTDELDTNKKLQKAIEAQQKVKEAPTNK